MSANDHFSSKSKEYSFSRPHYPDSLYEYLSSITPNNDVAWDCATGNGQAAIGLCRYFKKVIASDMSMSQIENGFKRQNIVYDIFPSEDTSLPDNSVDLITIAQAIHWFDFEKFYDEARRIGKKSGGKIAIWSYGMHKICPEIDKICDKLSFDGDLLRGYWPKQTEYIRDNYETIPFPFDQIIAPRFEMLVEWNLKDLLSYMETWSAVKRFELQNNYNPLDSVKKDLKLLWGTEKQRKSIRWDVNLKIGNILS